MGKCLLEGELVLAIDFDGTISTEPDMGKELVLQSECKRVLTRLCEDGIRLMLWTCRTGPALDEALDFLRANDMEHLFDTVNDQLPEVNEKYAPHVARKVGADFYIDDKNLMFKVDWNAIEEFIYGEEGFNEPIR
jgi:hydroxymethylpyrimidine pyrophosphatase-like HAD family hydrolase